MVKDYDEKDYLFEDDYEKPIQDLLFVEKMRRSDRAVE